MSLSRKTFHTAILVRNNTGYEAERLVVRDHLFSDPDEDLRLLKNLIALNTELSSLLNDPLS